MMVVGAAIGSLSGIVGVFLAWYFGVSASAAIVLTMTALFALAYLFAPTRGIVWERIFRRRAMHDVPDAEAITAV